MDDEDNDEKRRQRSDEARRAAMRQKIQDQRERDRQIAADIANVDKKTTKRIVFEDSDDGDDQDEETEKTAANGEKKTSRSSKRPKLFDSEDENDKDEEEDFEIKNRHSGPKGEKLMHLESRFNSDPRFKLDDKFAESDSDEDGNMEQSSEKQEMKLEKDKNRELLSKILGKSVEEKKPNTIESSTLKARPFTRFDPENPEHLEWMKAFEASKNPQKVKKTEESTNSDEDGNGSDEGDEDSTEKKKEEVVEKDEESGDESFEKAEIFFKMDDAFSAEMKERKDGDDPSTGGFSFLSMIGRKYDDEAVEDDGENLKKIEPTQSKAEPSGNVDKIEKSLLKVKVSTKFFVDPLSDEKIKSLAANFRRTQTVEKVIDKWAPHRDAIFKLWKKQRRDAVKKQKDSFSQMENENGKLIQETKMLLRLREMFKI